MTEDNTLALATPTRFLLESGEWNLTPTIRNSMADEINPFEYNFQERGLMQHTKPVEPPTLPTRSAISDFTVYTSSEEEETKTSSATSPSTPPMSVSQSPSNSSASSPISKTESQLVQPIESTTDTITNTSVKSRPTNVRRSTRTHTKPQLFNEIDNEHEFQINHQNQSKSSQSGRKRRIVFEGDDAEDRRKKFLERNRIAAYKCRQKKKNWMQELEQRADMANNQNEELRSIVAQLKEESMYLRNMLLTHGNCDCDTVQAYLRKTSAQLTASAENSHSPVLPFSYTPSRRDSTMSTATSYTMPPPPPILRDSVQSFHSSFSSYPEQSTGLTPFLNTVINKSEIGDYFS